MRFIELFADPHNNSPLLAGIRQRFASGASQTLIANLIGLLSQTFEATAGLIGNARDRHWHWLLPAPR